jgi:hypothetical protein
MRLRHIDRDLHWKLTLTLALRFSSLNTVLKIIPNTIAIPTLSITIPAMKIAFALLSLPRSILGCQRIGCAMGRLMTPVHMKLKL